jgi:16S rRNA processing protein RimM
MIKQEEVTKIGQFKKPHGVKGEITFTFTDDSFEDSECPFFISEIDGIFVPFRITGYRFTSDTAGMVHLKNLNSDSKVRFLSGKDIYFPKKYLVTNISKDSLAWNYFIGFTIFDEHHGKIGQITDIDESTINTLFIVYTEANEILIPAVKEFITSIDEGKKELWVGLPEGLLEL